MRQHPDETALLKHRLRQAVARLDNKDLEVRYRPTLFAWSFCATLGYLFMFKSCCGLSVRAAYVALMIRACWRRYFLFRLFRKKH